MKLKYNDEKDTFALKGLDVQHIELLAILLANVRLGAGDVYRESALELLEAIGAEVGDDFTGDANLFFTVDRDGFGAIEVGEMIGDVEDYPETGSVYIESATGDTNTKCSGCDGCNCQD
jgi:hypothetical protein